MRKFFLSIALVLGLANVAQAQFFGIDADKFVTMVEQVGKLPRDNAMLIVEQTMKAISDSPKGYRKALDLTLNRLGDPTDSIHNEDLYLVMLKHAATSTVLSNNEKARPQALLESALKNSVGTVAANIDYVTSNGTTGNLLNNDNKFTLVYFNDPDCDACAKVKENLSVNAVLKQAVDNGTLRVVAINPMDSEKLWKKVAMPEWVVNGWNKSQTINEGGSYDLPTLPVFYVLSRDNTVLLKNEPSLRRIEKAVTMLTAMPTADNKTLINLLFAK